MSQTLSPVFFLLFFIKTPFAYAQILNDETILISADKISHTVKKSTSEIQVITNTEINHFKSNNLDEILTEFTDLNVTRNGQIGATSSVSIRGMDTSHTIVVLDGIVLNDPTTPNRQFDFSKINLNNIDKIEIQKGSQGLLYGSNAIGGVIVLTSKKKKENSSNLKLSTGSYSTKNISYSTNRNLDQSHISFGIDYFHSLGFSSANDSNKSSNDRDANKKINLNLGIIHNFPDSFTVDFKTYFQNEKIDLDKGGGPQSDDSNYLCKNQTLYSLISFNKIFNENLKSDFKISRTEFNRRSFDQYDSYQTYDGSDYQKGFSQNIELNNSIYFNELFTQNINLSHNIETDTNSSSTNSSLYFYNKFDYFQTTSNFGIRIDHNKIFRDTITYKAALSHQIDSINLRTSYATGLKSPTLFQLFNKTYGNINLLPEKSRSVDFGIDTFLNTVIFKTTFYYIHLSNRHFYQSSIKKTINYGSSYSKGIEENIEVNLINNLVQLTNINLNESFDLGTGSRLTRRPELIVQHGYKLTLDYFEHFINFKFKSSTKDIDNNGNETKNNKYLNFNYNLEYFYKKNQTFSLNIENIFNSNYQDIWGYNNGGRIFNLRYVLHF